LLLRETYPGVPELFADMIAGFVMLDDTNLGRLPRSTGKRTDDLDHYRQAIPADLFNSRVAVSTAGTVVKISVRAEWWLQKPHVAVGDGLVGQFTESQDTLIKRWRMAKLFG
jgi:hypothetical protein